MRNIILLLILVSLTGCFATKKRCLRLYPPTSSVDTVYRETVRDSLVIRDTTIYVRIPGETFIDFIPIYVDNKITLDTARAETEYIRAKAYYSNGFIFLEVKQLDIGLEIKLENALRESYYWKEMYFEISNREIIKERYIPIIYKVSLWAWIGVILLIIFAYLLHRLRPYKNTR